MQIDPKIEKPTRTMLGHVIRGELDDLEMFIYAVGEETYRGALALCVLASGYIALDVSERWPNEADLREIARHTASSTKGFTLDEAQVYEYLSRTTLGGERLDEVFASAEDASAIPLMSTGTMLLAFCPREKQWWEYLDTIWTATETALATELSVLPALMFRARRPPVLEPR
jgi:hypothetical protein